MALTYATWVTDIANIAVSGVTTRNTEPPRQLRDSLLPLSFPRVPQASNQIIVMSGVTGLDEVVMEMVFLVGNAMIGLQGVTYTTTLALIDAINAAYKAATTTVYIDRWLIRQEEIEIDGAFYWALVAIVEASG